ncbi:chitobiosyldiphosphodolichol beta-mannosyltransferase-like [Clytia hemisphaerica]|uniref:chitobiosyldiphosphodolichol beta-mannosyltransferase-like n=1 Tax=Clytia hemisphaerica TaxID=252671 RepID=UPI0034D40D3F
MASVLLASLLTISSLQCAFALLFIICLIFRLRKDEKNVCVIVLGDIGRSPRMQYHAKSLILEGYQVGFIGYSGTSSINFLQNNENVTFKYLQQWPKHTHLPGSLNYILKAAFISVQLFLVLFFKKSFPAFYLIQNPPTIPSLMIVSAISCLRGAIMITDWHNYGYTILSMNVKSEKHFLVKFAKWFEGFFGYFSHQNICVTKAMQVDLQSKWKVEASVLYDKPPEHFKEVNHDEKARLFQKLIHAKCFDDYKTHPLWNSIESLASKDASQKKLKVIISSTSWTEDEDFSILLDALIRFEKEIATNSALPNLVCIITGKGPQKEFYKSKINKLNFQNIAIITPWLEADDYPTVVGSGDLGICLHLSSSGLDLPMKVVDMFGCCLPVCAVAFPCLDELVKHTKNGLIFSDSTELFEQMMELLSCSDEKLLEMKRHLQENFLKERWHENWKNVMFPIINK